MRTVEFYQIPSYACAALLNVHDCIIYALFMKDEGQIPWRTSRGLKLELLNLSSLSGERKLSIINGLPGSWCVHHVFFLFNLV